jgi:hypothetical protein
MKLLKEAAEWRLISLLLERPRAGWYEEVCHLSKELVNPELLNSANDAISAEEAKYLSIVGPGGRVSPREAAYIGFEDPGQMLSDLSAFYTAFAYEPKCEDPIDHIAVETGFMGFLTLKEAYAELSNDPESAEVTKSAKSRFMETHLARLARGMAHKLSGSGPQYFLETIQCIVKWLEGIPEIRFASNEMDPLASGCPME